MKTKNQIKRRLEYLRRELRAEQISYGELHELQCLAPHIEPGDVELLEAAGVPERVFFESEKESGTLWGAVLTNPSAAVRALGPLETIRIGCGTKGQP